VIVVARRSKPGRDGTVVSLAARHAVPVIYPSRAADGGAAERPAAPDNRSAFANSGLARGGRRAPPKERRVIAITNLTDPRPAACDASNVSAGRSSDPWQQRVSTPDLFLGRPVVEPNRTAAEVSDFDHDRYGRDLFA
jgi:hypothetical protein